METVKDFIFLGSKITAGGDCSHDIKRHLLLERKARLGVAQAGIKMAGRNINNSDMQMTSPLWQKANRN